MTITADTARAELSAQTITDPTDELVNVTTRMLAALASALEDDPTLNDYAGEISEHADDAAQHLTADDLYGSRDIMTYDSDLAEPGASAESRTMTVAWEVLNGIASAYVRENAPDPGSLPWDKVPTTSHGDLLIGRNDEGPAYVCVKFRDRDGRRELSVTGHTASSAGQCTRELDNLEPSPSYTADDIAELRRVWDRWHLNGMNAHCAHQRRVADVMGKSPHEVFTTSGYVADPDKIPSYDALYGKQMSRARNVCAICDYAYGSAWMSEDIPADVVSFLRRFSTSLDDQVATLLRADNPHDPSGQWSLYDLAQHMWTSGDGPVTADDIAVIRAAVGRLCPNGGRFVGGTSVYLYDLKG